MNGTLIGSDRPLSEVFDVALVDLDGVTYRGPEVIPSAPPALAAARARGMHLVFVTNNASRTAEEVAAHLTRVGIPATPGEVMTSAEAAGEILASRVAPGAPVLVVGAPGLRALIAARGFRVVESATESPVAVIQGWHPDVAWRDLEEASYAIEAGALYLVTNRDLTLPTERGLAPGNGSMIRAIVAATGVEPTSAGKPEPEMYRLAATRAMARSPLVVGDRLDTDLGGAHAAGFPGLLVLTGVSSARDAMVAPSSERPSFIGADLTCLNEPHPEPEEVDRGWRVGEAEARMNNGTLELRGTGIDAVRAACTAVWAARDRCEVVHIESLPRLGLE